jgi:hypothetical protein
MFRRIVYPATALALIALAIALGRKFSERGDLMWSDDEGVAMRAPENTYGESLTLPLDGPHDLSSSDGATAVPSSNPAPEMIRASGPERTERPAATLLRSEDSEPTSEVVIPTETSDPGAVIGRPFPVSASVEDECTEMVARLGDQSPCALRIELLSRMAQEPRDPVWAATTEKKIRDFVATEADQFTIRAVECRQSICALEVESIHGPWFTFGYGTEPDKVLREREGSTAHERNESGDRVTVTFTVYERR